MSGSHVFLAPDPVEAALEADCTTLMELELRRASASDHPDGTRQLTREIRLIRRRIAELRASRLGLSDPVAYGFVLDELPIDRNGEWSFRSCGE